MDARWRKRRGLTGLVVGALASAAVVGGIAAASGTADESYTACVDKNGGVKIVPPDTTDCPRGGTLIILVGPAGRVASAARADAAATADDADKLDGVDATGFARESHEHAAVGDFDALEDLPCRVGTADEGLVRIAYGSGGEATVSCAAGAQRWGRVEGYFETFGNPGVIYAHDGTSAVLVAELSESGPYSFELEPGQYYLWFGPFHNEWYDNICSGVSYDAPEWWGATPIAVATGATTSLNTAYADGACTNNVSPDS